MSNFSPPLQCVTGKSSKSFSLHATEVKASRACLLSSSPVCSTRVRHSARQICSLEKQRNAAWANLLSGGAQWAHTHTYICAEKILQLSQQPRARMKKMHLRCYCCWLPECVCYALFAVAGHTVWKAWCGFFPPSAQNTWLKGQHSCAVTSY